ncbi:uncharacterized protein LOC141685805 [Apium graveolens]|uniref:uncharacterized protein LOC141685805 n=1 Tax=Apium graveolens TaxID=4045 RepID=UPI003D7AA0A4
MPISLVSGCSWRAQDAQTSSGPKNQGHNRFNLRMVGRRPPYPVETVAMTADAPQHYAIKEKSKWSDPEKAAILKDSKTAKEIWDALETQCQGPITIKKNRRAVLVQEYEQFDAKADESITDIYDRFLTLLNDLSLTLDEVYGMLKTHDLDIQQRKNRKGQKMKVVALNAETHKGKEKMSERSRRRNIMEVSDTDDISDLDTDTDEDSEIDMDDPQVVEMAVMLLTGFRRMRGNLANECPKTTGKALVTKNSNRDWMDSSGTDNDDECYALMATHGEDASRTDKFLHVTFKSKTIECDSLIADNKRLKERNDFLEAELVCMHENEKACYNKFANRKINKSINNTTSVKFVGTYEKGVESVYEFCSTSKNNAEEKAEPRVPAKKKEDHKMKPKKKVSKIPECDISGRSGNKKNVLVLDSGCSIHMTGTKSMLLEYEEKVGSMVSCGNGNVGKTLGYDNIIIGNVIISIVTLVE